MLSGDDRSQAEPSIHSAFRVHRRASWGSNQADWTFPIRGLRYLYPLVPTVILDPIDGELMLALCSLGRVADQLFIPFPARASLVVLALITGPSKQCR